MKPVVFFRKFHKWLGLIIGIQLLLWVVGGFVMSFFDIEEVRGEDRIAEQAVADLSQPLAVSAAEAIRLSGIDAEQVVLKSWLNKPVWLVNGEESQALIDATQGELITPLPEITARQVAEADFLGEEPVEQIKLITEPVGEARGKNYPLWQVIFSDDDETRIYVSQQSGEVVARRNNTWRLFDFFWMLHIMDYDERTDFNNPLLIFAALLAILMSISGLYLVIKLIFFKPKRRT
ncbi:PepSY domain-containing protein [Kangiella sediminilitoris]|uniref:PepSY-associated TM helix n=1 Tax=Kangiella sediminilitoris TaxID=1144748 RepID=A0A1B3BCN4_9GAMM|nr:PepSY domain-containing protein [Kangiella sediminilitoris]AOE50570.1 PepSY-associated TM helix [Kangiella sediminilitoris]